MPFMMCILKLMMKDLCSYTNRKIEITGVQTEMDNEKKTVMTQTENLTVSRCSSVACDLMPLMVRLYVI